MVHLVRGSIARSDAELLVCPVDCLGAANGTTSWGAARLLRLRFPDVFAEYAAECARGDVTVGGIREFRPGGRDASHTGHDSWHNARVLVLVVVKHHMRALVQPEHVDEILDRLHDVVRAIAASERIESVAMPALGYEPSAGPWSTAWPALEARIGAVFRGRESARWKRYEVGSSDTGRSLARPVGCDIQMMRRRPCSAGPMGPG